MPEGDNIHAHAIALAALVGEPLTGVWSRGVEMRGLRKQAVARVEAIGKHVVIAFDEGSAVRVHLGIAGSWRRVRRPSTATLAQAELALATAAGAWIAKARQVEWTRARLAAGARALRRLGPDLLARDAPSLDAIVARARSPEHAARPIGELLLDQTIAAGLGNVYKCELLFLHGVHPWRRVDSIDDATLRALYADGMRLLAANVGRARTTTQRRDVRYWVYGRFRRACIRCGAAILLERQRPSLRPTFWCPRCQPEASSIPSGASRI
ncbi:MAG TPA: formamidopyrimidine DNA glycosylase [Polyangia bacterium]|jgi:endonuclease-8